MILSGQSIRARGIFTPFSERTREFGLTHGVGPAGYDVRIDQDIFMWPGRFSLASTMEHFDMPTDLLGIVHDKSTWARMGIACQNTVIEPGWKGYLTLELTNHGPEPVELKKGMPIAQIIFHVLDQHSSVAYDGKYQNQKRGAQPAIFEPVASFSPTSG